ncbi:Eukaryotic translation initiation factor 1A [Linum grandiflorum]
MKRGKNEADVKKRELIFMEDGQGYAQVMRMHKKIWIAAGGIILVGPRDDQDGKVNVVRQYTNVNLTKPFDVDFPISQA